MKKFILRLIEKGIYLSKEGDKLNVEFNGSSIPTDLLEEIKQHKTELLQYFDKGTKLSNYNEIKPVENSNNYPISDAQRRLWILSQFPESSRAYNLSGIMELERGINCENLNKAILAVIERHEILRTIFIEEETGEVKQRVLPNDVVEFRLGYQDFRKAENKTEDLNSYLAEQKGIAFDLSKGPLLRATLIQMSEDQFTLFFNMHHIISDGWSMEVLFKDILIHYEAFEEGRDPNLKPLRVHYKDYAAWQLSQLSGEQAKKHKSFWLSKLSGELMSIDLPGTKVRPSIKTHHGTQVATHLSKNLSTKLKQYTEENGGSLFIGLLAVWNVLMHRYTSETDIIVGTPTAGRDHADLEQQIGFYINTLVLRNTVDPNESFATFFNKLKENIFECYDHQTYPFDRLVDDLNLKRDTSRSPLFDVMLVLQNNGEKQGDFQPSDEEIKGIVDLGKTTSRFDIEVNFHEIGEFVSMKVIFNHDIYDLKMVERLMTHYKQLLAQLLENPSAKIGTVDYLTNSEKQQLLVCSENLNVSYPKDKTIIDLFEKQVKDTPDHIAVVFEETVLTYRELDMKSNQLANYLIEHYTIQPDELIGIKLERSEWMVIAILAILKSGGAYVPIDPAFPKERMEFIEKDANCKVCIDETELSAFRAQAETYSIDKTTIGICPENLIYVLYTSGSTGRPKGVLLEHKGLVNRLHWMQRDLKVSEKDTFIQKTPFSFDVSVWEFFLPLISGSKLIVAKPDAHKDATYLSTVFTNHQVSIVHFVPSMLNSALPEINWKQLNNLRHVICSGEALPRKLEESFAQSAPFAQLHNYYGPTEASIDVTAINLSANPTKRGEVSIGKPVDNTSIYIVNEKNILQPVGVVGEILIGGDQVARGYLNREELNRERFIVNPFAEGERLYRTGDLGKWSADGTIEFLGRKDDQIKIRGHRIELGEIEYVLEKHPLLEQVIVLARSNQNDEKELVAYIVSREAQNAMELRTYLEGYLPKYMLPAYFVQVPEFPLTNNGKVDTRALPAPEEMGLLGGAEYLAPRDETEEVLIRILANLLSRSENQIGIRDNFFDLGVNSISIMRLYGLINNEFDSNLRAVTMFEHPTVESLAKYLKNSSSFVYEEQDIEEDEFSSLDDMIDLMDNME